MYYKSELDGLSKKQRKSESDGILHCQDFNNAKLRYREAKATLKVIDSKYTCIAGEERSKVRRIKDGCANRREQIGSHIVGFDATEMTLTGKPDEAYTIHVFKNREISQHKRRKKQPNMQSGETEKTQDTFLKKKKKSMFPNVHD